nr:hypothetical protein [Tanacetum cinerariifolium]
MHQLDKLKTNDYFLLIPTCFEPSQPRTDDIHDPSRKDPNDYHLFTPQSHYETEEVSSDKDVDEWLNEELSKCITGQDKTSEIQGVSFAAKKEEGDSSETLPYQQQSNKINTGSFTLPCTVGNLKIYVMADVRVGIKMMPKSVFEHLKLANLKKTSMAIEMGNMTKKALLGIVENIPGVSFAAKEEEGDSSETLPYQQQSNKINPGSFTLPCTVGNLKIYVMADVRAGIKMMPKSVFEHLKLANLKKTSMAIEMGNMTKKALLGIVENIPVKIDKFLFYSDFVDINTLKEPDETILLGRPLLATIHAQIDVSRGEISLGVGN